LTGSPWAVGHYSLPAFPAGTVSLSIQPFSSDKGEFNGGVFNMVLLVGIALSLSPVAITSKHSGRGRVRFTRVDKHLWN